ncbi:MAG: tyrosine recombinase XerS [Bacillaceae bacterium]|nr:tyrosine recombinase XerS [Bacillaceae bacterium]
MALSSENKDKTLNSFPWFVKEYFDNSNLVTQTKEGYIIDLLTFFNWLSNSKLNNCLISEVSLKDLQNLKARDIVQFKKYLETNIFNPRNNKSGLSDSAVSRKLSALSSLFNYLAYKAEFDDGEPYLNYNAVSHIRITKVKNENINSIKKLDDSLFLTEEEYNKFRTFIVKDYELMIKNNRQLLLYQRNKERDIAIISLLLESGLRVKELTNLQLENLDLEKNKIITNDCTRSTVVLPEQAKVDLENYLKVRKVRYNPNENVVDVFITRYSQSAKSLSVRAVQNIIDKYAEAFGMVGLTAQRLRYSFAINLYKRTNDLRYVNDQLAQKSTNWKWFYNSFEDNL